MPGESAFGAMSTDDNLSLFDLGEKFLRCFAGLQDALSQKEPKFITSFDEVDIIEVNDRFILWASNIGLFNPAHTSLDYRLRDNELIKKFTRNLLQSLSKNISERKPVYIHFISQMSGFNVA